MKALLLAVGFAVGLVGCASERHLDIGGNRPGATQAQWSGELLECEAMSQRVFHDQELEIVKECMQAKGWNVKVRPHVDT